MEAATFSPLVLKQRLQPTLLLLMLLFAAFLISSSCSTVIPQPVTTPPDITPALAQKALQSMLQTKLYGPEELLQRAAKPSAAPRNWKTLAQRLATPGSTIKVVALGGSVTAGYGIKNRKQNWAQQLVDWLQAAFPDVVFQLE
jgi:hypothetical protein